MTDRTVAVALSALLVLSMATAALAGTTAAERPTDSAATVDADGVLQADGPDATQVEPGDTMTISGTTTQSAEENNVTVMVTDGPGADAFETVTIEEWEGEEWTAAVPVPSDAEPGTYTAEITVGDSTTTLEFEVVEQQAAQENETTTEEDGAIAVGDDETNETAANETDVVVGDNETGAMQADNETDATQVEPGETMTISGTTTQSADENNVTVMVTDGPGADAFETVTIEEWEGEEWTAAVPVPSDAEPGTYTAEITVGDSTTTLEFEVVEQQAAQENETTTEEDGVAVGDNETTTEEDGIGVGDNETETTTEEDGVAVDDNETETTEEDGIGVGDNETETTEEDGIGVGDNETEEDGVGVGDNETEAEPGAGVDETTTPGQPGFGLAVALAALVVSLLALARRMR